MATAVVAAALVLARINQDASRAVNYVESIRSSAEDLVTAAATFSALADQIGSLERAEFETSMTTTVDSLDAAAQAVADPPERGSLIGVASLFRLTVSTWTEGVRTFSEGMLRSADGAGAGEEQIYAGLQQVAAGDELFLGVVAELARSDVPDPIISLPEIEFLPAPLPPVALARLFAAAAAADNSLLALRADLAVEQVTAEPEWVADPDGDLVISATEILTVKVVVANRGNTLAPAQALVLGISGPEGEQTLNAEVPGLDAGAQTTVVFESIPVAPGFNYRLGVVLQLSAADGNSRNDGIALEFFVNEPVQ
ncbi:MAG: hypothetical protein ACT4OP_02815 [Actinomycetota bacterium]